MPYCGGCRAYYDYAYDLFRHLEQLHELDVSAMTPEDIKTWIQQV